VTLRAVLDTNLLVSGLGWPGPPAALLDAAFDGRIHLVTSQPLLDELMRVLEYPRLEVMLTNSGMSASELVKSIAASSIVVAPTRRIRRAPDPEDNRVLEAAVADGVAAIVTGDHDLLSLCAFEGVPIIGASEGAARLLHAT
jgi:uncharacterized protein